MINKMQKHSFLRSAEGRIASYDWFDFAAGAGYQTFYCVGGKDNSGNQFFLSTQALESDAENVNTSTSSTADVDFDITFNKPVTIAGADAYFRCSITTGGGVSAYIVANVYHVTAAGVETSIGTGTCDSVAASQTNAIKSWKFTLTKKSFSIGEKLRVNFIFTSSGATSTFQHNAGTTGNTLKAEIPFVVDL